MGRKSDDACPSRPVDVPGPVALRAFADESIRTSAARSFYVLAAAVIPADRCVPVRDALRSLLLRRQTRLHWRDEDRPRRGKIASTVAEARVEALVVIGAPVQPTGNLPRAPLRLWPTARGRSTIAGGDIEQRRETS